MSPSRTKKRAQEVLAARAERLQEAQGSDYETGYREGTAKVVADVEAVLREHGLINTREALSDLRDVLTRYV